jgi:hypothetical protein
MDIMRKKEELMTLIEEADNMEEEKHKQKTRLEFIQQQADLEQDNFK